jgi:hypothetical protein
MEVKKLFSIFSEKKIGNCALPQFEQDAFCSSIVNYNTWIYENITSRDQDAYDRYLWLTEQFTCGQTDDCHGALRVTHTSKNKAHIFRSSLATNHSLLAIQKDLSLALALALALM